MQGRGRGTWDSAGIATVAIACPGVTAIRLVVRIPRKGQEGVNEGDIGLCQIGEGEFEGAEGDAAAGEQGEVVDGRFESECMFYEIQCCLPNIVCEREDNS